METRESKAIAEGISFLDNFIEKPAHLSKHWADFLLEFTNIVETATPSIANRADQICKKVANSISQQQPSLLSEPSLKNCWRLGVACFTGHCELIDPKLEIRTIEAYCRDATESARRGKWTAPKNKREHYKFCTENLILAYIGYQSKTCIGHSLSETFADALNQRPYKSREEIGHDAFTAQGFVVTHIVYIASDYNRKQLDPELIAPEKNYMLNTLDQLIDNGEVELLGEYLDALRTCGVEKSDPKWQRAAEWLLEQQNTDGSWGDLQEENTYKRYHVTLAAVQGLRDYKYEENSELDLCIQHHLHAKLSLDQEVFSPDETPIENSELLDQRSLSREIVVWQTLISKPLLLKAGCHDFPALDKWTDSFLISQLGDEEVEVEVSSDELFASPERPRDLLLLSIREYIERKLVKNHSNTEQNLYLAQVSLEKNLSTLLQDIPVESFLPNSNNCDKKLWFSFEDRITPLHFDREHNLFLQIRGKKRFTLFSPEQSLLLYPATALGKDHFSLVDVLNPSLKAHPAYAHASSSQINLTAGDALILPMYWWHHVQSFGTSLGVSVWWR